MSDDLQELTDEVLREVETTESDHEVRSRAKQGMNSVDATEIVENVDKKKATVESLEREANDVFDQAKNIKKHIESRENEDEFQQHKSNNAVDSGDYDRARDLADLYERMIAKLTLQREIAWNTMKQLDMIVDVQQLRKDEAEVLKGLEKLQDVFEDSMKRTAESYQQSIERQVSSLESTSSELQKTMKVLRQHVEHQADREDALIDALEVKASAADIESLKEQLEEKQELLEQKEERIEALESKLDDDTGGGVDEVLSVYDDEKVEELTEDQRRVLRGLTQGKSPEEIAEETNMKEKNVNGIQGALSQKGFDPSEHV